MDMFIEEKRMKFFVDTADISELRELAAARSGQLASCERDLAVLNTAY